MKIWAEDQDQQLCDYYHYYEHLGHALPAGICYLTPYGTCPSQKSIGDLRPDQIRQISFQRDITRWLNAIIQKADEQQNFRTADTARQFQEVIRSMTDTNTERSQTPCSRRCNQWKTQHPELPVSEPGFYPAQFPASLSSDGPVPIA